MIFSSSFFLCWSSSLLHSRLIEDILFLSPSSSCLVFTLRSFSSYSASLLLISSSSGSASLLSLSLHHPSSPYPSTSISFSPSTQCLVPFSCPITLLWFVICSCLISLLCYFLSICVYVSVYMFVSIRLSLCLCFSVCLSLSLHTLPPPCLQRTVSSPQGMRVARPAKTPAFK